MNANELADLLDFDAKTLNWKAFADAATMLRQQQADLKIADDAHDILTRTINEQQLRITELEIENNLLRDDVFDLREAEEKLRKAQEKCQ